MTEREKIIEEAGLAGYTIWGNYCYYGMADAVRNCVNAENPKHTACLSLFPDDSWVVWYRNQNGRC